MYSPSTRCPFHFSPAHFGHSAFFLFVVHQLKWDTALLHQIWSLACPTWFTLDALACHQPMQSLAFVQLIKKKPYEFCICTLCTFHTLCTDCEYTVGLLAVCVWAPVTNLLACEPHLSRTNMRNVHELNNSSRTSRTGVRHLRTWCYFFLWGGGGVRIL